MTLLTSVKFCFLLSTFNSVFAYYDVMFGILQNKEFDVPFRLSSIDDFCRTTERERGGFWLNFDYEDVREIGAPSRHKAQRQGDVCAVYQQLHSQILDNILTQLRRRFKDHEKLLFLVLLDPKKFSTYKENFLNSEFESLGETMGCTSISLGSRLNWQSCTTCQTSREGAQQTCFISFHRSSWLRACSSFITSLVVDHPCIHHFSWAAFLGPEAHQDACQEHNKTGLSGSLGANVKRERASLGA